MKFYTFALCGAMIFVSNVSQAEVVSSDTCEQATQETSQENPKYSDYQQSQYPPNAPKPLPPSIHPMPVRPQIIPDDEVEIPEVFEQELQEAAQASPKYSNFQQSEYPPHVPKPLPPSIHPMPVRSQTITQETPFETLTLRKEKEKWLYLRAAFGIRLKNYTTFTNKFGSFIKNHAFLLSTPFGAGGAALSLTALFMDELYKKAIARVAGITLFQGLKNINKTRIIIGTLIFGIVCQIIAYYFNKHIGSWLEAKPESCTRVLKKYVSQWNIHKDHTPAQLVPLFEKLYADLDISTGEFKTFSNEQARLFVENTLATSIIIVDALA